MEEATHRICAAVVCVCQVSRKGRRRGLGWEWGFTAHEHERTLWGDGNVLKPDWVMFAQPGKFTKSNWMVPYDGWILWLSKCFSLLGQPKRAHRMDGLKQVLETTSPRSRCGRVWFLWGLSPWLVDGCLLSPSSPGLVSSNRDPGQTRLGPTIMTSL